MEKQIETTRQQIRQLQREAREAGDEAQHLLCEDALAGSLDAWDECSRVIAEVQARTA